MTKNKTDPQIRDAETKIETAIFPDIDIGRDTEAYRTEGRRMITNPESGVETEALRNVTQRLEIDSEARVQTSKESKG